MYIVNSMQKVFREKKKRSIFAMQNLERINNDILLI